MILHGLKSESFKDDRSENQIEAERIWEQFLEIVRVNVSYLKFNTWFRPIRPKSFENNTLLIEVPSGDYYDMIISRFGEIVSKALDHVLGENGRLV